MDRSSEDVTQLLVDWSGGDDRALEKLMPIVYDDLRRQAANYLRRERQGHTLQTTALVHEAFMRLVDQRKVQWQNRAHFFAISARLMRRILVDHARKHTAAKRGGPEIRVPLDEATVVSGEPAVDLIALDEALDRLAELDPRQARIVEIRYFGGLSIEETAEVLGVSPTTVNTDWSLARSWLRREMRRGEST